MVAATNPTEKTSNDETELESQENGATGDNRGNGATNDPNSVY